MSGGLKLARSADIDGPEALPTPASCVLRSCSRSMIFPSASRKRSRLLANWAHSWVPADFKRMRPSWRPPAAAGRDNGLCVANVNNLATAKPQHQRAQCSPLMAGKLRAILQTGPFAAPSPPILYLNHSMFDGLVLVNEVDCRTLQPRRTTSQQSPALN